MNVSLTQKAWSIHLLALERVFDYYFFFPFWGFPSIIMVRAFTLDVKSMLIENLGGIILSRHPMLNG
jgi:hypothetical protein